MVLGILSSGSGCADFRLTLDLNKVFISVDLPRPLWPETDLKESYFYHTGNAALIFYSIKPTLTIS